ncbi:hypothetical protein [Geodermatophilus africanus]|uniref:hypothetical protein n=1 Tax=Geodermatophilus africanus TaxID=1137993 RepID=UPI001114C5E6|nr:hypothetical protein [Geodermatophilus africanus]
MPQIRRSRELPPVTLAEDELRYVAGLLDGLGALRTFVRGNGQEVVRLTVGNLRADQVQRLRDGFGVGSQRGAVSATGRGLTWAVEGRWACLHVGNKVLPYLPQSSPLWRDLVTLRITAISSPAEAVAHGSARSRR